MSLPMRCRNDSQIVLGTCRVVDVTTSRASWEPQREQVSSQRLIKVLRTTFRGTRECYGVRWSTGNGVARRPQRELAAPQCQRVPPQPVPRAVSHVTMKLT